MAGYAAYFSRPEFAYLMGLLAALLLVGAIVAVRRKRTRWLKHICRKPMLTPNEVEFFHRLRRALPAYQVFPQVAFGAFITDDGKLSANARWSIRARFDRKIADFVICDRKSFAIVALIELDDRLHNARADRERDALTKAAGYQTFRFQSRQKPSETVISALFQHAHAWTQR